MLQMTQVILDDRPPFKNVTPSMSNERLRGELRVDGYNQLNMERKIMKEKMQQYLHKTSVWRTPNFENK